MTYYSKQTMSSQQPPANPGTFQGQVMSTAMLHEFTHAPASIGTPYLSTYSRCWAMFFFLASQLIT